MAPGPLNHSSRYLASACDTFHAPLSALLRDVDILILRQQSDRILKIRRRCGGRGERRPVCGLASLRLRGPSLGPDTPGQGAHFYSSGATFMPLERGRPAAGWTDRPRAAPGLSRAAVPASRDSWGSLKVGNHILFLDSAAFTHRRHLWVSPLGWLLVFSLAPPVL